MSSHSFSGRRASSVGAQALAAELRAQALQLQVERLSHDLTRLRAAARDYLTAFPPDQPGASARLRHLLGHDGDGRTAA